MTTIDDPEPADPAADAAAPPPTADATDADAFAERVFGMILGAQQVQAIDLGDRLGWYRALAGAGPLTSAELAARSDSDERYAREWLEHQAVCGVVTVDDPAAAPGERRFMLPAAHAAVLADPDSLSFLAPIARFVGASGLALDKLADAYRTGGGVSWADLGDDARQAQAAANRPLFLRRLGQEMLPAVPEVHERLLRAERVADVGCGFGWSAIGLARAYPASRSTATTSTSPRSTPPAATPPRPASPTVSGSTWPTSATGRAGGRRRLRRRVRVRVRPRPARPGGGARRHGRPWRRTTASWW